MSMTRKLKSNAGESLTEVLVALLISVVAITMLASVIATSGSILEKGNGNINEYVAAGSALEEQQTSATTGKVSIVNGSGTAVALTGRTQIDVYYYDITDGMEKPTVPQGKVVAYRAK